MSTTRDRRPFGGGGLDVDERRSRTNGGTWRARRQPVIDDGRAPGKNAGNPCPVWASPHVDTRPTFELGRSPTILDRASSTA